MMDATTLEPAKAAEKSSTQRYAKCIEASRRVRWEIDRDVIRGRSFDFGRKFLPDGLSKVRDLPFLTGAEGHFFSQVQGRTYANMFGLVERYIGAKTLELGRAHAMGDQVAFEALVRMTDEELKHQEMFRRIEAAIGAQMPAGYVMTADPNAVAQAVLAASTWAVLALTLDIELFTQAHYRASIEGQTHLCPLWKDVFLYHWKEESQHAILDELELLAEDRKLTPAERDAAVDQLIELVGAVDGILQGQARADADYFVAIAGRAFSADEADQIHDGVLKAYRWQYLISGVMEPRFQKTLFSMLTEAQGARIQKALAPLTYAVPKQPEMALPMVA